MTKFKFILTMLLSSILILLHAAHPSPVKPETTITALEENCSLPAPSNLQVTNVTTNTITVDWTPVPGAFDYEAIAYDVITNTPTGYGLPSIPNSAAIGGLTPGTEYRIEVAAKCSANSVSPNKSVVYARTNIVIEIVNTGYNCTPSNSWNTHTLNGTGFSETIYLYNDYVCEVTKTTSEGSTISRFELQVTDKARFYNYSTNAGSLQGGGNTSDFISPTDGTLFTIQMQSVNTSSVSLLIQNPVNNSNYTFKMTICAGGGGRSLRGEGLEVRSDWADYEGDLTISPNPFTAYLSIQFPEDKDIDGPATAGIYHLNGMLVQSATLDAAAGKTLTMNTSDLPAGMYLLRTETLTGVTTKLVMKAE